MMKKILQIEGMTCGHCKMKVEEALSSMEGLTNVDVDLIEGKAEIESNEYIKDELLEKKILEAGYKITSIQEQ